MKRVLIPKSKFARLAINIAFIFAWYIICYLIIASIQKEFILFLGLDPYSNFSANLFWVYLLLPIFFVTKYIWFKKSRDRIFFGLFSKFEPKIYTKISNADELKKYAELRDQGIITEIEFQAKKKKLLDL